jgi:hypothetical protein
VYVPASRIGVERSEPDLAVVEVVGEHDLSTAPERAVRFAVAVPPGGGDGVRKVVDVTGLGTAVMLADDRATAITTVREGGRE